LTRSGEAEGHLFLLAEGERRLIRSVGEEMLLTRWRAEERHLSLREERERRPILLKVEGPQVQLHRMD